MDEMLKVLVPSALAFIGSLVAIAVSYRKWKREQISAKRQPFEQERRVVHKELWDKIEEIHIRLRVDGGLGNEEFTELTQNANAFILKNSIYLGSDIHGLAGKYLESIKKLEDSISRLPEDPDPGEADINAGMQTGLSTSEIKRKRRITAFVSIPEEIEDVSNAQKHANELRQQLEGRIRAILEST